MQPTSDYPLDYTKGPSSTARTTHDQPDGATLQKAAEDLLDQARAYGSKAQDALRNAKPFLEKSVKEQPMITLAALAAAGFVLGALWKR
jgi:ElaB/YqjD/DUF883 family membrane-anchored ribosome-binding protein